LRNRDTRQDRVQEHDALLLHHGGRTWALCEGRRLTIGSSPRADLVLDLPGVRKQHARVGLLPDGRLHVRSLNDAEILFGPRRSRGGFRLEPGEAFQCGLARIETEPVRADFRMHLALALGDLRREFGRRLEDTPWLMASILLHLLLLALLTRVLPRSSPRTGPPPRILALGGGSEKLMDERENPVELPDDPPEISAPEPIVPTPSPPPGARRAEEDSTIEDPGLGAEAPKEAELEGFGGELFAKTFESKKKDRKQGSRKIPGDLAKGFRRTLARMRRKGFEVALLFDSTSSMGGSLEEAKKELRAIFLLFRELVPSTRIGLITYRDRGDDYVVRKTRLGIGLYEGLAFLSSVVAGGGGDFEEAVDEAMAAALRLPWRPGAEKAMILVGDAPPHPGRREKRCLRIARTFASRRGRVHCLLVGNNEGTMRSFGRIAEAGKGRSLGLDETEMLATRLLVLALGSDSARDIPRLLKRWHSREKRTWLAALNVRELPSPSLLLRTLRSPKPDALIVESWTRAPFRRLMTTLRTIGSRRLEPEGLMALIYLLNRRIRSRNLHGSGGFFRPETLPPGQDRIPSKLRRFLSRYR